MKKLINEEYRLKKERMEQEYIKQEQERIEQEYKLQQFKYERTLSELKNYFHYRKCTVCKKRNISVLNEEWKTKCLDCYYTKKPLTLKK
jgi:hypothetical protein